MSRRKKREELGDVEPFNVRVCTAEEVEQIKAEVREWWARSPSAFRFKDVKSSASVAIAEFIANKRGLTIYKPFKEVTPNNPNEIVR